MVNFVLAEAQERSTRATGQANHIRKGVICCYLNVDNEGINEHPSFTQSYRVVRYSVLVS